MVSYLNTSGKTVFIMTSNKTRDAYYLYDAISNKKLGKSKNPTDLEKKFDVVNIIRGDRSGRKQV